MSNLPALPLDQSAIVGVILAGGQSLRMQRDKSQVLLQNQPLLSWVAQRLRPQTRQLLISRPFASSIVSSPPDCDIADDSPHDGPLSGIKLALTWLVTRGGNWLVSSSCDTPFIPMDLATRLTSQLNTLPASGLCYARCGQQHHYTQALWSVSLLPELENYLQNGQRSLKGFMTQVGAQTTDFPCYTLADQAIDPFININTPADLARWQDFLKVHHDWQRHISP